MAQYLSLLESEKVIASAIVIGTPIFYLAIFHNRLSKRIHHTTEKGTPKIKETSDIKSIPDSSLNNGCFMINDIASKHVPKSLLPALDTKALLTTYLRYTMTRFSYLPQAWILRLISDRATFNKSYIQNLDFEDGDVVCGLYRVVLRTDEKVELLMQQGTVQGRLVIGIEDEGNEMKFYSETVMWKAKDDKTVMPLERAVPKWLHELASWWLLDSGTNYLVGLKKSS